MSDTLQELATWWARLTFGQRALRALSIALAFTVSLAAKLQGWTAIPDRLGQVEATLIRQDSAIQRLQRGEKRAEYLFCVDLADRALITKTPQDCFQDYSQ